MIDKPVSDLRRRIIADMTIRSFSDKTQRDCIRQIEAFASFLGRPPDTATGDDIRRFQFAQVEQVEQVEQGAATEDEWPSLGVALLLHARPRRPRPSAGAHTLSAQAAAGPCAGSGRPADRGRAGSSALAMIARD
jgi:hypothetical protein